MDLSEFDLDKKIDPLQLDIEAVRLPEIFFKWAEKAVEAKSEVDRLKLKADTILAEMENDIREKPGRYGLEKATDASVKAKAATQEKYQQANERYFRARDDSALLDKAVQAIEIKKRMIEVLVTLFGQQYFAGPSMPRNLTAVYVAQQAVVDERVTAKTYIRKRGERPS